MKRGLCWTGLLVCLFLGAAVATIYYLLFTTSGCQLVVRSISHFSRQTIEVAEISGHLGESLQLKELKVHSAQATLNLEQVQLDLQPRRLLAGEIRVRRLFLSGIDLAVAHRDGAGEGSPSSFSLPDIDVPLSLVIDSLEVENAVLAERDKGQPLTGIDHFQARVQVKEQTLSLQSVLFESSLYQGSGEVTLQLHRGWPVQLTGDWQVAPPGCSQLEGRVELSGSITDPMFSVHVRSPQEITLHGSIKDLLGRPTFTLNGSSTAFDPSRLCSSYPILSIDTSFTADGSPDEYQVQARVRVEHEQYGQLESTVQVTGNREGIALHPAQFKHHKSEAKVSGRLNWEDEFSWTLDVDAENFNPADYALAGEGAISGSIHTSGKWGVKEKTVRLELTDLAGVYNGLEVTGQGRGGWQDGHLVLSELRVTNGENSIIVQGHVGDRYDLAIEAAIPELGDFFPQLSGGADLTGKVSGPFGAPALQMLVGVHDFSGYQVSFDQFTSECLVALDGENKFEITGLLEGGQVKGREIRQFRFNADGIKAAHQISGFVQSDAGHADFAATGGLYSNLLWKGTLHTLGLQHPDYNSWSLSGETAITLSPRQLRVDPFCFNSVNSSICLEGSWEKDNSWHAAIAPAHVQLVALEAVLPVPVSGVVEGNILVQGSGSTLKEFSGHLFSDEIHIAIQDQLRNQDGLKGTGQITFYLDNRNLHLDLSIQEGMGGQLEGHAILSEVTDLKAPFSSGQLKGTFALRAGDTGWVQDLYSDMLISGEPVAQIEITGQLTAPVIAVDVSLPDGDIEFPFLGIGLSELQAQMIRNADGSIDGTVYASSDAGFARGTGRISFLHNSWNGKLHIQGSNVELLHRDGFHLWGDPDLELVFSSHGGHLSGTMNIPKAEIRPEDSIKSETVSGDVVFVDVDQPGQTWPFTYDIALHLGEAVVVEGYGFKGYLDGDLQITEPQRGGMILGTGLFKVRDGVFSFRGSQMKVGEGRITFNGGPVNNPELDVELRKEVEPQNLGDEPVTVGVDISGSALDYQVDLYATPAMEDKNILTYILFDRSIEQDGEDAGNTLILSALESLGFDQSSTLISEASKILPLGLSDMQFSGNIDGDDTYIGVRKKMTDDLSIHYDFNLFKSAGRFRVVYQLIRGFSMEITNTVDANGIRLLYSFER